MRRVGCGTGVKTTTLNLPLAVHRHRVMFVCPVSDQQVLGTVVQTKWWLLMFTALPAGQCQRMAIHGLLEIEDTHRRRTLR